MLLDFIPVFVLWKQNDLYFSVLQFTKKTLVPRDRIWSRSKNQRNNIRGEGTRTDRRYHIAAEDWKRTAVHRSTRVFIVKSKHYKYIHFHPMLKG